MPRRGGTQFRRKHRAFESQSNARRNESEEERHERRQNANVQRAIPLESVSSA